MNGDILRFFFRNDFPDTSLSLDFTKSPVEDVTVDGKSVVSNHVAKITGCGGGGKDKTIAHVFKHCDYLYSIRYEDTDYAFAENYFKNFKPKVYGSLQMKPFGCSSIRVGNNYGRNFDFYYNNDGSFVVRVTKKNGRYASVGVGSVFEKLSKDIIESGKYTDAYKILPFMMVDGINENGVFVNINVVTVEGMPTTGTEPTCTKKGELCMMMMPRFILDNYSSAKEAILDIESHYSVYAYNSSVIQGSELHFMIGDEKETYMVEFVDNKMIYEKLGKKHPPIMTNFYTLSTKLIDGKIDETPENKSKVALLGCGIERYNKLIDRMGSIKTKDDTVEAMKDIWYSKSYDPQYKMYTEMVGMPDNLEKGKILTVETPRDHFEPTLEKAKEMYAKRDRGQGTHGVWHTTHCSVYDIKERKLYLHVQEDEILAKEFEFDLNEKIAIE